MVRKTPANRDAVRAAVSQYRPDLAEMFDSKMGRREARRQAWRHAKTRTGFGIAEILLFVQVLMALWAIWQKYQERQASFLAATSDDPELVAFVAKVADGGES
jgi:hypothetical protein